MKAIILARVSTKDQEDGQSIPAQVRRLTEYAEKKQLSILKVSQITESSTKESRKEFEKIIDLISKSKEPIVLIADTVDRVQRGFKESILIEKLLREGKMELHFLRDRLILDKNSNSTDVMRWDMSVMFAKAYVLQLSDNVKRSLEQLRKEGIRANLAPLGYLNVIDQQGNKDEIPDPNQRHLIVKMFELYVTGNYSFRQITELMKEMGLKNKQGGHVSHSKVADALKDPFYCGIMKAKNEFYPHKHEPIISPNLFQKAQEVRLGHNKKPFQYAAKPFIFRGMITCGHCGCLVSPEIKKGKYVYYSCTNAKGTCQRDYINEKDFLKDVSHHFNEISLSQEIIQEITQYLKEIYASEGRFYQEQKNRLRKEQDQIQQRLSKLYDDRYDGNVDEAFFQKKLKEYKDREFAIIQEMESHAKADESFHVTANMVLSLAQRYREIFESSEVEEKRQLLNFVFQNLELKEKKLSVTLREPFKMIKDASLSGKRPRICR
jgi:DNA invertase Pin-like site-specific DNA recombinase